MNATINKETGYNMNIGHRKDKGYCGAYIGLAVDSGAITEAVTVRFYETASRVYCCAWIQGVSSGSGYAGGGGYHKRSAAAGVALRKAGVTLSEDIDGRGDGAIREAIEAITRTLYPDATDVVVVDSHA